MNAHDPTDLDNKLADLGSRLRTLGSVLVCYSGGVDSAFVAAVASRELGSRAIAMTAVSPSLPESERVAAVDLARALGIDHRLVESHEIDDPGYANNGPDRCYFCKSELYRIAAAKRAEWGLSSVVNGTNLDDLGDYRPGLDAARVSGALSPLVDAGFTKRDVRAGAAAIGLSVWDKPATACLSSRLPYGTSVTAERLGQIGGFEADLRALGFRQVRVRWHDAIARIEVGLEELAAATDPSIRSRVVDAGRLRGFRYVTLDLGGYRAGSHNEVLVGRALKIVE